jgi:hypothetical protein
MFVLFGASAQDINELQSVLHSAGFEQELIFPMSSKEGEIVYMIGVEHRGINNPSEVLTLANSISEKLGFKQNKFVLLYKGQPLYESTIRDNFISSTNLSDTNSRDLFRKFSIKDYRLNIVIDPDIQVRFGSFENPIQSKLSLLIGSDIMLFRGFSLFTGILIPVQNDLDNESNNPKLGPTFFEFFTQVVPNHYAQLSLGLFYNNRYGIDLEYRFFPHAKRFSMGFRYAKTGFYYFPERSIFFDSLDDNLMLINLEYLFVKERISASLDFGQFLQKDQGFKFSLFKQYKNIEVGFFSTITKLGNTSGFNFTIPLFPGKLIRSKSFELRTNDSFRWEYSYSNDGVIGRDFNSNRSIKNNLRRFNSNLLNKY